MASMVKITRLSLLEIEGTWILQVGKTFSTELLYKKNLPEGSNQVGKIIFADDQFPWCLVDNGTPEFHPSKVLAINS